MKVIVNGVGAAGSSIIKMMYNYGFKNILAFDSRAFCIRIKKLQHAEAGTAGIHESARRKPGRSESGVSWRGRVHRRFKGNLLTKEDIATMNKDCFIVALANPTRKSTTMKRKKGGALIAATGRSDLNQVNNLLALNIFRDLRLDARRPRT